jgi:predicted  nucleic acid-binding Zn-ribbon protein
MSKYVTNEKPTNPLWSLRVVLTPAERAARLARISMTAAEVAVERATNPVEDEPEPEPVRKKRVRRRNETKEQAKIRRRKERSKASVARVKAMVEAMSPQERAAYQADVREKRRLRDAVKDEARRVLDRTKQLERERKRYKRRSEMTEAELAEIRAKDKARNRKKPREACNGKETSH